MRGSKYFCLLPLRERAFMVSDREHHISEGEIMNEAIRSEIERLRTLKIPALQLRYREVFGEDTEVANHAHLLRRIGWKLQAISEGDLTDRARSRAAELIADADLRLNSRR